MNEERNGIIRALIYPAIFVVLIWLVKLFEITFKIDLAPFGLQPLSVPGLLGIITAPFLHEGFSHLFANSIPLFFLGGLLFFFYKELAWRTLILITLLTGIWVWVFARGNAVHIGASGVVYGLASFLFLSGIIRRETKLMAITLLTTFLYGSMVWGVFPQFFPMKQISWESHLMGLLAGALVAFYFRNKGPQRKKYEWEDEEEDQESAEEFIEEIPSEEKPVDTTNTTGNETTQYRYTEKQD
jgi:membrane associated rhomboid family serine protease